MSKHRWIWIGLLGAGALAAVIALGGCADRRGGQEAHRGGRYALEAAPRSGRTTPSTPPGQAGRQGRGGAGREPGAQPQRSAQERPDAYALQAADRRGSQRGGARTAASAQDKDGRGVVESGELLSLAGTLESRNSEWYLTQEGSRYLLHLGNARYVESTGIRLREGAAVQVRGFAEDGEVAVVSILIGGQRFDFRAEDGTPLWAGRGRQTAGGGRNGAGNGSGRTRGAGT